MHSRSLHTTATSTTTATSAHASHRPALFPLRQAADLADETMTSEPAAHAEAWAKLKGADGILVPGGFGDRGVEGKIAAVRYARESKVPFFGICLGFQVPLLLTLREPPHIPRIPQISHPASPSLGFQVAVIEFARSQLGHADAHSAEFSKETKHPMVVFMPEVSRTHMGGTMRLGARRTVLSRPTCVTAQLYGGVTAFDERHRHRYEVNIEYVKSLEAKGLEFVGRDTTGERMEVFELANHPYFVGCQFHPEFKSRPMKASPLFLGLLLAASGQPIPAVDAK